MRSLVVGDGAFFVNSHLDARPSGREVLGQTLPGMRRGWGPAHFETRLRQ